MAWLLLVVALAVALAGLGSADPVWPLCPTSGSCALASGIASSVSVAPSSATLLYMDVPANQTYLAVQFGYPIGNNKPALFYRPWETPVVQLLENAIVPVCGTQATANSFQINSPNPGRYYFAIANNSPSSSVSVTLNVTMVNCPLPGTAGIVCSSVTGTYTGGAVDVPIANSLWYSMRPNASYSFDTTLFNYAAWDSIVLTAEVSPPILTASAQFPTITLDYGNIGTASMEDMEETWRDQAHVACSQDDWNVQGGQCTVTLKHPKRGMWYINVFPPRNAPGLEYSVSVSVAVQAVADSELVDLNSLNNPPLTASLEQSYLYVDLAAASDATTYTFMACPQGGVSLSNVFVGVAYNSVADASDINCNVAAPEENAAPHWFFSAAAAGRYYLRVAGLPTDGSWTLHFTNNRGVCPLPSGDGGDSSDDEADKVGYSLLITWLTLCACGCFLTIVAAVVVSAVILYNKQQSRGSYETLNEKTLYDNL